MNSETNHLHLFAGFGVELEYMIVSKNDLRVLPVADKLIYDEVGAYVSDVEFGNIAWSNELVQHVVELKTQGPVASLVGLADTFQQHIQKINGMLEKYDAMLLPTGAHPLMDPHQETVIWQHEHNAIYEAYNRIFDCRGHGWANLQSTHLNLPFADDAEFEKLHAAIRMILPILPALSASSPILDGKLTGFQDTRLEVYRLNQQKIPSITGHVIPERVFSRKDYEEQILQRSYADVAPHDPDGVLMDEFLNSRGAIARFGRGTIEIRLLDIQECPAADMAILQAVVVVLEALVGGRWGRWRTLEEQKQFDEKELADIFLQVIRTGQETLLTDIKYLHFFSMDKAEGCSAGELWYHLLFDLADFSEQPEVKHALDVILTQGNLSRRILKALGENPTPERIQEVYRQLAACLQNGKVFTP
ncbi:carboxylate-amine ligase [Botryobacter ruber]|uniref:carboxylate-amine ligase n=1 Tax=Botryobacter ruber TaxID=2171629 RepID=UPI000E0B4BBE|nr:glutamate-cysteine ligase family protein [Botryobacter ruber]